MAKSKGLIRTAEQLAMQKGKHGVSLNTELHDRLYDAKHPYMQAIEERIKQDFTTGDFAYRADDREISND